MSAILRRLPTGADIRRARKPGDRADTFIRLKDGGYLRTAILVAGYREAASDDEREMRSLLREVIAIRKAGGKK